MSGRWRVVIIGGGFGGLSAALKSDQIHKMDQDPH
jgi:NADH dehydrogenase FAD-containing subunit